MLQYILLALPVIFLVVSVYYAYKSVALGKKTRKTAVIRQIASFAIVATFCLVKRALPWYHGFGKSE